MADRTPVRRSTRAQKSNKKYSVDPFEGLDLRASSDSGLPSSSEETDGSEVDEDFSDQKLDEIVIDEDELESSTSEYEEDIAELQVQGEYPGESLLDGNESIVDAEDDVTAIKPRIRGHGKSATRTRSAAHLGGSKRHAVHDAAQRSLPAFSIGPKPIPTNVKYRTRAIQDLASHAAKDTRLMYNFGPTDEDLTPIIVARDRWIDQPTFPSLVPDSHGVGGFDYSNYYTPQMRMNEATHGWIWYDERGGKEAFARRQIEAVLAHPHGEQYLPPLSSLNVLMGPYSHQRLFNLKTRASVKINDAFRESAVTKRPRQGYVLNIGAKPDSIEWAPNMSGSTQYLAVTTEANSCLKEGNSTEAHFNSASNVSHHSGAVIQIWAIHHMNTGVVNNDMIEARLPILEAVFILDSGPVKELKFCPMAKVIEHGDKIHLGLIAGVWGDGRVRVLDLSYSNLHSTSRQTQYVKISEAAFSACPPSTVCTSIAWLSPSSIAAGCANGCVAIWDLSSVIESSTNNEIGPRAWFYHTFHHTYILRVVSCWPSRPHLLVTVSMDGYHRLTDLRCPDFDFVLSNRTRVGQGSVVWHDHTQGALFVDDNYAFRSMPLRRFFASIWQARAHAPAVVLASSLHHPFVLGGCADGDVVSYNPIRRALYSKSDVFIQTWFKHEWRREMRPLPPKDHPTPAADDQSLQDTIRSSTESLLALPMSRITEGYKVERPKGLENSDQGVVYTTIFERNSAISALSWNPNHAFAGWAAAGMASGLVRLENIGV